MPVGGRPRDGEVLRFARNDSRSEGIMPMANVHKDFHGGFSYGLQYLQDNYGEDALYDYLRKMARTVYSPLIEELKKDGLAAMAAHLARIFTLEEGEFELSFNGDRLVLNVNKCPAIHHMKGQGYMIADKFCEATRIVNEEICHAAGYECSVDCEQQNGRCVQEFWQAGRKEGE